MSTKPYIGQMNRKIEIIGKVISRTDTLAEITTEQVIASPWAYMQEISGNETQEGKIVHLVNRTYTIRSNKNILKQAAQLQLRDAGSKYEIIHAKEISKTHMELICRLHE